jgi:uncharacterized tellurite resistance protein B-like protein
MPTANHRKTLTMLEKIQHFFTHHISLLDPKENSEEKLKVASAALFMEMMHAETAYENDKQQLILTLLEKSFRLTEAQASTLIEIGEQKRKQATDYFEFTHLISTEFTREQKIQLIESLWEIAFMDNHLDLDEEYLIDKVARLLFIPRIEVLEVRNRIRKS